MYIRKQVYQCTIKRKAICDNFKNKWMTVIPLQEDNQTIFTHIEKVWATS